MSDPTRSKIIEVMAEGIRLSRVDDVYDADEIASDILAHLSAEGMAVVPVEPSEAMIEAGRRELFADLKLGDALDAWRAMLSASPYGKASMQEASAKREARSEQIPPGKEESK